MRKSNLDLLMNRYIHQQTSDIITANIDLLLRSMRENNINSFPDDKEELIFTTLCCDDLSMGAIKEFVIKHGENIDLTEVTFKDLMVKWKSNRKS